MKRSPMILQNDHQIPWADYQIVDFDVLVYDGEHVTLVSVDDLL